MPIKKPNLSGLRGMKGLGGKPDRAGGFVRGGRVETTFTSLLAVALVAAVLVTGLGAQTDRADPPTDLEFVAVTSTPLPTATALPTSTALPTATALPTSTALPTEQPYSDAATWWASVPTNTPLPTYTPQATYTTVPTHTPLPTYTLQATNTPLPTPTSPFPVVTVTP